MKRIVSVFLGSLVVALVGGCASPDGGEEDTAEASLDLVHILHPNSLDPAALTGTTLALQPLRVGSISPLNWATLQASTPAGDRFRELVRYAVGCAFSTGQSFTFSRQVDGKTTTETYHGGIGIAPTWASTPLSSVSAQRLVTACLAARTNYYGEHVEISMRSTMGPFPSGTPAQELTDNPYIEGVFWGNVFSSSPSVSACKVSTNAAHSRAADRVCAAGLPAGSSSPCGLIQVLGDCSSYCGSLTHDTDLYPGCSTSVGGMAIGEIITTALP